MWKYRAYQSGQTTNGNNPFETQKTGKNLEIPFQSIEFNDNVTFWNNWNKTILIRLL
jgi:hypothetical protein